MLHVKSESEISRCSSVTVCSSFGGSVEPVKLLVFTVDGHLYLEVAGFRCHRDKVVTPEPGHRTKPIKPTNLPSCCDYSQRS